MTGRGRGAGRGSATRGGPSSSGKGSGRRRGGAAAPGVGGTSWRGEQGEDADGMRKRPRAGEKDGPSAPPLPVSDAESADSRTPPRVNTNRIVRPMRAEDVNAIADTLFQKMMPNMTRLVEGLLEPVVRQVRTASTVPAPVRPAGVPASAESDQHLGGGTGDTAAAVATSVAAMGMESVRVTVREELNAFEERRQPALAQQQKDTIEKISETVGAAVRMCFKEKPVELMTDEELQKAVVSALPTRTVRQHHGPVLNESITMFMEDERYKGDALTASFPPSSSLLDTLVNEGFTKIILGIVERVYNANGDPPDEKQPHVFKGKANIVPNALDRVDRTVINLVRNVLHDPRCKTRRLLTVLFFYYLLDNSGSIKLVRPDEPKPASTSGAGAMYFAVEMDVQATCSGLLPVGDAPAPQHKDDAPAGSPLEGVHQVKREAHLYKLAETTLQKLVREAYKFDPEVIFSVADTLRTIMLDPDVSWKTMDHKDADEIVHTGAWALLLPSGEVRADAKQLVQTLTSKEKDAIQAKHREVARAAAAPTSSASGGGASGGGAPPAVTSNGNSSSAAGARSTGSTAWLRRLAQSVSCSHSWLVDCWRREREVRGHRLVLRWSGSLIRARLCGARRVSAADESAEQFLV